MDLQDPVVLADYVKIPPKHKKLMHSLFLGTENAADGLCFPGCAYVCWDVARIVRSPTLYRRSHGMSDTYRWSESSYTPCTAALDPSAILRNKHSTVSDRNIIDWIPNIIYSSIRDILGTVWSSRHQLYQASDHLVRSWCSRGEGAVEFVLFFLLVHPY